MKNKYLGELLEDLEKLRDTCINIHPNKELAEYYQGWVDQINTRNITDERLWKWIENQANYWQPKDRGYTQFLENILEECLENSTK